MFRLNYALATCMRQQTHAERLVAELVQHHGLAVETLPFYFFRVRANGYLAFKDLRQDAYTVPVCNASMLEPLMPPAEEIAAGLSAEVQERSAATQQQAAAQLQQPAAPRSGQGAGAEPAHHAAAKLQQRAAAATGQRADTQDQRRAAAKPKQQSLSELGTQESAVLQQQAAAGSHRQAVSTAEQELLPVQQQQGSIEPVLPLQLLPREQAVS